MNLRAKFNTKMSKCSGSPYLILEQLFAHVCSNALYMIYRYSFLKPKFIERPSHMNKFHDRINGIVKTDIVTTPTQPQHNLNLTQPSWV